MRYYVLVFIVSIILLALTVSEMFSNPYGGTGPVGPEVDWWTRIKDKLVYFILVFIMFIISGIGILTQLKKKNCDE